MDPHGTFEGERVLSDSEIAAISQWVTDGVPEGKASDLPDPITFPETWSGGKPNAVTQPSEAYPLKAGADDIYRCFPMLVPSSSDLYVRGYEVLPGNRSIVHHGGPSPFCGLSGEGYQRRRVGWSFELWVMGFEYPKLITQNPKLPVRSRRRRGRHAERIRGCRRAESTGS